MILDTMDRRGQYCESYPAVYRALEAMAGYTADNYPGGRVTVDGDALFLLLNQYTTRSPENAMAEAHRQYLDVMYMVKGSETIYVKPTDRLQTITKPYSAEGDALLAKTDFDASSIHLQTGSFVVLFPQDAHSPACWGPNGADTVKKIIAKIRID